MSPRRRNGDHPRFEAPRRREDLLEELLKKGSRNFRRYRRRAFVAFVLLAATNAVAIYIAVRNADQGRQDLAVASAQTQFKSCVSGNRLRVGILTYLGLVVRPEHRQQAVGQARTVFSLRNCREAVEPIQDAASAP